MSTGTGETTKAAVQVWRPCWSKTRSCWLATVMSRTCLSVRVRNASWLYNLETDKYGNFYMNIIERNKSLLSQGQICFYSLCIFMSDMKNIHTHIIHLDTCAYLHSFPFVAEDINNTTLFVTADTIRATGMGPKCRQLGRQNNFSDLLTFEGLKASIGRYVRRQGSGMDTGRDSSPGLKPKA